MTISLKRRSLFNVFIVGNILLATFAAVYTTMITPIAGKQIQGALALSNSSTAWLTTIYLLGINTAVPSASWFGDRFGYKKMYLIGLGLFGVATFATGQATNFPVLIIGRILEGVGAGILFPIGLSILIKTLPKEQVPLGLMLYVMAAFGAGFAIGPPAAGWVSQFMSWRWAFFLILPQTFILFLLFLLFGEESEKNKQTPLDLIGYVAFVIFIGSLLVALTYGPMLSTDEGWHSNWIRALFALAAVCLMMTIYIEMHHPNPILPLALFKDPLFSVTCVAMFLLGMSIFASVATMAQYMIEALMYERYVTGKLLMIYGIALSAFSLLASFLIKKIPVPVLTFIGLMILVYSYFLNQILDWQTGPKQILTILCIRGIGVGLALGPATVEAMSHVPSHLSSKGATILTFFRQVGGTYGGTLIGIITIRRNIFHLARFGEQTHTELPGYQVTYQKLLSHYQNSFFDPTESSESLAKATIVRNIEIQSYVTAVNDAMMIVGYVTSVVAVGLITLSLVNWVRAKKACHPAEKT